MKLSRSFAAGAVGLLSCVSMSIPMLASAGITDYTYCVNYGYPNLGDCASQGYGSGGGYNNGYSYNYPSYNYSQYQYPQQQQYYYPQQNYGYQYQQPTYYYPQQYQQQQYSYYNYPQRYYQPTSYNYVVPNVQLYNGYYAGSYGMGGYYR